MRVIAKRGDPIATADAPGGVTFMISWSQLELMLRSAGSVRPSESVDTLYISRDGIQVYVEKNP